MKLTSFTAWHLVMQTLSQSFCSSTKPYIFSGIPLATIPMASPLMKITSDPLNSGTRIKPTLSAICVCGVEGGWRGRGGGGVVQMKVHLSHA